VNPRLLKSDQDGIESVHRINHRSYPCIRLKSDQDGIESHAGAFLPQFHDLLKSDQDGIERKLIVWLRPVYVWLKSDQDGIERIPSLF